MDLFLIIFFVAFFLLVIVLGPIYGAESRQAFLYPNEKPRPNS